ncbi:lipocalin family protein [uncultured Aquimarina sp.]|uniref:lipocalin family protein n=1 Tax=uncultured Aquimarina sp. TaxID=575652 RepID=UPI0026321CA6|nr:lipocalin family protein [uncultured Aquimarina sp.]
MKKIILLFAVIISISMISCQTDDDAGPADTQDKFIGNWKITQEFEDGVEVAVEVCDLQDVLTVTDDQKFSGTSHIMENGACKLEDTLTGTWENLGDNKYKITPELDGAEAIEATITFSGNTMTIDTTDEEGDFKQILTRI